MQSTKMAQREIRTRAYVTYYLNSRKQDPFFDPRLKQWKRKVESRLTAYIKGEASAKDIIHPSKYNGLSQEAIKHKLQKTKMLQSHRNAFYARHESTIDWVQLGKLLDRGAKIDSPETPVTKSEPPPQKTETKPRSPEPKPQPTATNREDPKNTVVFNGNVNILCLNVNSRQLDTVGDARRICGEIDRELKMLNSCPSASDDEPTSELQLFRNTAPPVQPLALYGNPTTSVNKSENSNADELTRMVNELLPAVQKLRGRHQQLLSDCRELTAERKILLKHQEITDKTISLLSEETAELKEKNRFLVQRSEIAIKKLNEQNQRLAEMVIKKGNEQNELYKRNHNLVQKLRQESVEKQRLVSSINIFNTKLNEKVKNIEKCFDSTVDCVRRIEKEVQELKNNSGDSVDKKVLLNTIRNLDEQNSNLMGKVKHIPEKIKNILDHVSCTMSTLEEQNIRLLRTLQNSEIESFFEDKFLKRIKV